MTKRRYPLYNRNVILDGRNQMGWTAYLILVIFGLFVLLSILNPNFSCFGRRLRSPFYPLYRHKKKKQVKTHDYGFYLVDDQSSGKEELSPKDVYYLDDKESGKKEGPKETVKTGPSKDNGLSSYKVDSK